MAIKVPHQHIDITNTSVRISDQGFLNDLVKNPDQAMAVLQTAGKFSLDDISIDMAGTIVIRNQAFAKGMKDKLSTLGQAQSVLDNGACGAGC